MRLVTSHVPVDSMSRHSGCGTSGGRGRRVEQHTFVFAADALYADLLCLAQLLAVQALGRGSSFLLDLMQWSLSSKLLTVDKDHGSSGGPELEVVRGWIEKGEGGEWRRSGLVARCVVEASEGRGRRGMGRQEGDGLQGHGCDGGGQSE